VHRESVSIIVQQYATIYSLLYFCKLLYMFRVVTPSIIRSTYNCINIIFNLRTATFKAYCAIWVKRSNFRHQASPRVSPRESTQRRKVEPWARKSENFA